ncbi:FAD-dependent oxidoreductase [Neisseria sp. CCUG12390]|uniref:FAD-dependent oxidoreductase n=1 Tax=Neisseria sp. CCUG12390 TaxID=3392035 RepID=UPI003A102E40
MEHIAVLGGGLAGRLTAWGLAQQGFEVSLFEQGTRAGERSAAYVAAAMLAPLAESVEATPLVVSLGRQSMALWRGITGRLKTPVFHQENGSLIVWHGQDKPLSRDFQQHLSRANQGVNPAVHWSAADIAANEPQLAGRFSDGLYLPDEGQLDNRQVLVSLADTLEDCGVHCHWETFREISDLTEFDGIIDCRGYGAKTRWNRPSERSRLRGVRGEVARVYAPEVSLNRPVRLLHPRYPLYIAPKENHLFVIGATQLESESDAPASVRSGLELLSALYAVHPAFGEAEIREIAVGLRPTLNHHDPEIRYSKTDKLIEINGLFRHGFMISPAVADAAVRLAVNLFGGGGIPESDSVTDLAYLRLEAV